MAYYGGGSTRIKELEKKIGKNRAKIELVQQIWVEPAEPDFLKKNRVEPAELDFGKKIGLDRLNSILCLRALPAVALCKRFLTDIAFSQTCRGEERRGR